MKELTKGYPAKVIILFTLPLIIGNILQKFYDITDSKIVSYYAGGNALAAIGASTAISNLIIGIISGLTQGYSILIARSFGSRNIEKTRRTIAGSIILTAIVSIFLTIVMEILCNPFLRLLKTEEKILNSATTYLGIVIIGSIFVGAYNCAANILRALGDSRRPLYCLIISVVLNIILDLVFVNYLQMGVSGAAIATVIAQGVSAVACVLCMIVYGKEYLPKKENFKLQYFEMKELMLSGLAMGLMICIVNIGTLFTQGAINELGTRVLIAHVAARRILDIVMVMVYSVGFSMTTYVSQNVGAGYYGRVKQGVKHALIIDTIISTIICVAIFALCRPLVAFVASSTDADIVNNGEIYLKVGVVFFFVLGPLFILRCSLQGMGQRVVPILSSVLEFVTKVLTALLLIPVIKYLGVCFTEPISWCVMTLLLGIAYIIEVKKLPQ